jgi:hypothetical protein
VAAGSVQIVTFPFKGGGAIAERAGRQIELFARRLRESPAAERVLRVSQVARTTPLRLTAAGLRGVGAVQRVIGITEAAPREVPFTTPTRTAEQLEEVARRIESPEIISEIGMATRGFGRAFEQRPARQGALLLVAGIFTAGAGTAKLGTQLATPTLSRFVPTSILTKTPIVAETAVALGLGIPFVTETVTRIKTSPEPTVELGQAAADVVSLGVGAQLGRDVFLAAQSAGISATRIATGGRKIPIEQLTRPEVIAFQEPGLRQGPLFRGDIVSTRFTIPQQPPVTPLKFPLARSPAASLKQFRAQEFRLPGTEQLGGVQTFTATTARFPKETAVLAGRGAISPVDPRGLFVSEAVSIRFLRLGKTPAEVGPRFTLLPEPVPRPTIVGIQVGAVERVPVRVRTGEPFSVIRKGDVFLAEQAGRDVAFISPRQEARFTRESEAIIAETTQLVRTTKRPFRFTTEVGGVEVPIPEFRIAPTRVTKGVRRLILPEPVRRSIGQIKALQRSSSAFFRGRTQISLIRPRTSTLSQSRISSEVSTPSRVSEPSRFVSPISRPPVSRPPPSIISPPPSRPPPSRVPRRDGRRDGRDSLSRFIGRSDVSRVSVSRGITRTTTTLDFDLRPKKFKQPKFEGRLRRTFKFQPSLIGIELGLKQKLEDLPKAFTGLEFRPVAI